jgi:hypothetical protein
LPKQVQKVLTESFGYFQLHQEGPQQRPIMGLKVVDAYINPRIGYDRSHQSFAKIVLNSRGNKKDRPTKDKAHGPELIFSGVLIKYTNAS